MGRQNSELYDALQHYWREQESALTRELPAVVAGTDAEALHRFRVALRRTRSLLKLFGPMLPAGELDADALYAEFGWLGQITGALRDLDVLLSVVKDRRDGKLQPLVVRLEAQRAETLTHLRTLLRGARVRRLLADWHDLLRALPQCKAPPPVARVPLRQLFDVQLLTLAIRVLKHGSRIDAGTDATELHRLRIRAKRLRYLIEAFPKQLPKKHGKVLRRRLAALQDLLGAHQDAVATAGRLQRESAAEPLPAATTRAVRGWLRELHQAQSESRASLPTALLMFAAECDRL